MRSVARHEQEKKERKKETERGGGGGGGERSEREKGIGFRVLDCALNTSRLDLRSCDF